MSALPPDRREHLRAFIPADTAQKILAAGVSQERRVVTAIFCDVVGSTVLGERLGPERFKVVIDQVLGRIIGAIARYGFSGLVQRLAGGSFPAGTLAVNVAGCFLIGALMYLAEQRNLFAPGTRLFLMVGVLGSFTTLSAVGYETFEFLREGSLVPALLNAAANTALGVAAVIAGWIAIKAFLPLL